MKDALEQLKDIHLPPPVSWWPPAPGWWLLALMLVGLVSWGIIRLRRRRAAPDLYREALAALEKIESDWRSHGNAAHLAADISALLRRVAISRYPGTDVAGMAGEAWLRWLDEQLGGQDFSKGAGRALLEAGYRPDAELENPEALLALTRRWLERMAKEVRHA
ncbi:DUF4381 domain-containing protein [Thiolapillus sp.]